MPEEGKKPAPNVVPLNGNTPPPSEHVMRTLEDMLARARTGSIQSVIVVAHDVNSGSIFGYHVADFLKLTLVGTMQMVGHMIIKSAITKLSYQETELQQVVAEQG